MIEPNTDALTLVFVSLIAFLPITLHVLFGVSRYESTATGQEADDD